MSPGSILECSGTEHHAASNNASLKFKFLVTAWAKIRFWLPIVIRSLLRRYALLVMWTLESGRTLSLKVRRVLSIPLQTFAHSLRGRSPANSALLSVSPLTGSPWKINDYFTGKFFVGIEAVKLTSQKEHKLVPKWILSLLWSLWIEFTFGSCLSSVFLFNECLCLTVWVSHTHLLIMFIIMLRVVIVSNINSNYETQIGVCVCYCKVRP